jgi:hypothetical protein
MQYQDNKCTARNIYALNFTIANALAEVKLSRHKYAVKLDHLLKHPETLCAVLGMFMYYSCCCL